MRHSQWCESKMVKEPLNSLGKSCIDASTLVGQQALIDIAMLAAKQNVRDFVDT